jgi:hypothetical protein
MQPLQNGAFVFATRALTKRDADVPIIPATVFYFKKDSFRSDAIVSFHTPLNARAAQANLLEPILTPATLHPPPPESTPPLPNSTLDAPSEQETSHGAAEIPPPPPKELQVLSISSRGGGVHSYAFRVPII